SQINAVWHEVDRTIALEQLHSIGMVAVRSERRFPGRERARTVSRWSDMLIASSCGDRSKNPGSADIRSALLCQVIVIDGPTRQHSLVGRRDRGAFEIIGLERHGGIAPVPLGALAEGRRVA